MKINKYWVFNNSHTQNYICSYVFIIYIYICIIYADILANPPHMHHTKHVFCVPLHVMQSRVPLHIRCARPAVCAAKSDFVHTWVFAWQHGGKMHCIRHCMCMVRPVHTLITGDSINAMQLHRHNCIQQCMSRMGRNIWKSAHIKVLHGVSIGIAALLQQNYILQP